MCVLSNNIMHIQHAVLYAFGGGISSSLEKENSLCVLENVSNCALILVHFIFSLLARNVWWQGG